MTQELTPRLVAFSLDDLRCYAMGRKCGEDDEGILRRLPAELNQVPDGQPVNSEHITQLLRMGGSQGLVAQCPQLAALKFTKDDARAFPQDLKSELKGESFEEYDARVRKYFAARLRKISREVGGFPDKFTIDLTLLQLDMDITFYRRIIDLDWEYLKKFYIDNPNSRSLSSDAIAGIESFSNEVFKMIKKLRELEEAREDYVHRYPLPVKEGVGRWADEGDDRVVTR